MVPRGGNVVRRIQNVLPDRIRVPDRRKPGTGLRGRARTRRAAHGLRTTRHRTALRTVTGVGRSGFSRHRRTRKTERTNRPGRPDARGPGPGFGRSGERPGREPGLRSRAGARTGIRVRSVLDGRRRRGHVGPRYVAVEKSRFPGHHRERPGRGQVQQVVAVHGPVRRFGGN